MKTLLNKQWLRWIVSGAPAVIVYIWAHPYFGPIQYTLITYMPGALISLMGFIIAGAAIVVSMRGQGVLKDFADRSPENWNRLMEQFFRSSRYCIIYTFFLLFTDALPLPSGDAILTRLVYSVSAAGFVLILVQLAMAMTALEGASMLSSTPTESERVDDDMHNGAGHHPTTFKKPDSSKRVYESRARSTARTDDGP